MLIKAGVDISRLRPEIRKKLNEIAMTVWTLEEKELIIVNVDFRGKPQGSLHYADLAVGVKRQDRGNAVKEELRFKLGTNYDIVLEADHIHIEYDPK